MGTLYDMLGVSPNAEPEVIQAAYRALLHKHHPDKNGGRSDARAKEIIEAGRTLSNPALRAAYDSHLHTASTHQQAAGRRRSPPDETRAAPARAPTRFDAALESTALVITRLFLILCAAGGLLLSLLLGFYKPVFGVISGTLCLYFLFAFMVPNRVAKTGYTLGRFCSRLRPSTSRRS